jgi:phage terminase large subunit-like protein
VEQQRFLLPQFRANAVHVGDLAISTKESSDYTAAVPGEVTWPNGKLEIYIQPHPLIRRMTFTETMEALDNIRHSTTMSSEFFVEAVAYQQAAIEEMERRAFAVQAMHPIKDKRARLRVAARYIKMGVVKFPRTGCEQLMTQLLGFGSEKHDDAVMRLFISSLVWLGTVLKSRRCITFEWCYLLPPPRQAAQSIGVPNGGMAYSPVFGSRP